MFPDFEGTSGASSYDGKHAPGALGVLQEIEKGLWHSTRHTVKDQLRGVSYGLGYPMSVLLEAVSNRLSELDLTMEAT